MKDLQRRLLLTTLVLFLAGCGETASESNDSARQGNRLINAAMKVQRAPEADGASNQGSDPTPSPVVPGQNRTRPTAKNIGGIADPSSVLSGSEQGSARPAGQGGSIIHQKTGDVRDAEALRKSGGVVANPKVRGRDPVTISFSVYSRGRFRAAQMSIKSGLQAFYGEEGRYPRDYDEFKSEVLDRYQLQLPALPRYQKYGYDAQKRELIILEYPDLK